MNNLKQELIKILKENIEFFYNKDQDKMVINFDYLADQIHDYVTDDGLTQIINKINLKAIRGKGEQSFIDGCDLDDIKESYGPQHYEKEIYVDGFWQGYLEAYQDTTGLHLPLP
jgi:hypothetical protein